MQKDLFKTVSFKNINDLYSHDNSPRYQLLLEKFQSIYGHQPQFIARAPGRVNIIGQHIDYQGYGVLPAAIQKDCLIAVSTNNSTNISLNHTHPELYPAATLPVDPHHAAQFTNNYAKYFRAGYRAVTKQAKAQNLKGLNIVIQGNVPIAAGVSSSSALCVCSALATLYANGIVSNFEKKQDFVEKCIIGQRQTGTASGGMDQSISVMGQKNFCLYIQFNPIRCTPVHLPSGCRFVVMNSLVQSAKLNTAVFRYNKRVCECRMALAIIARKLGVPLSQGKDNYKILKEIQQWSKLPLNTLSSLVDSYLERKDYSLQQIQEAVGSSVIQLLSDIQLHKEVLQANKIFKLNEAAVHVFNQAYRVINFTQVCRSNLSDKDKLKMLGKLMNQSQASCRDLYECSCPELDELTNLAREKGAYGSRLTGAGWGGCSVSLVDSSICESFMERMKTDYYEKKPELKEKIEKIGIQNIVFESIPSQGACIILLDN